jgi:hypothetical protein
LSTLGLFGNVPDIAALIYAAADEMLSIWVPSNRKAGALVGGNFENWRAGFPYIPLQNYASIRRACEFHSIRGRPFNIPNGIGIAFERMPCSKSHVAPIGARDPPEIEAFDGSILTG